MSILSEILSTGHVDKELLDALDDEQKQLLFCQMRAEQVRKWEDFEDRMNRDGPPKRDLTKRRIEWLTGPDGQVWVWVMGDHDADRTIDQILEDEARKEAHNRALRELVPSASSSSDDLPEEALKAQLGSLKVGAGVIDSMYDDADTLMDGTRALLFQPVSQKLKNGADVSPMSTTVSSYNTPQPMRPEVRAPPPPIPQRPPTLPRMNQPIPVTVWNPDEARSNTLPSNGVKLRTPKPVETKQEEVEKRESEIFQSLQQKRERIRREAEAEADRQRVEWETQNRRAREAEAAMREMAQKAREQHRQLIRTSTSILPALKDTKATSLREAIKNLPRPPKPRSRQAIIEWFRRDELPRGTGLDPKTRGPAPWFHGIITREQAEVLLQGKPTGSYLVRVSERIWGYTVSYVVGDGSFKHFLVEKIAEGYQFLGTNQVVHSQLFDLVSYHETAPITAKGGEILKWSVGQNNRMAADYLDILPEDIVYSNRYAGRF